MTIAIIFFIIGIIMIIKSYRFKKKVSIETSHKIEEIEKQIQDKEGELISIFESYNGNREDIPQIFDKIHEFSWLVALREALKDKMVRLRRFYPS